MTATKTTKKTRKGCYMTLSIESNGTSSTWEMIPAHYLPTFHITETDAFGISKRIIRASNPEWLQTWNKFRSLWDKF